MRREIFFLTPFLAAFLVTMAVSTWAASPFEMDARERYSQPPPPRSTPAQQNSLRPLREIIEQGKSRLESLATPPGRLREKVATAVGRISFWKTRVWRGTVSNLSSSTQTFTLTTGQGAKTIQTSEKTRFLRGRFKDGVAANFASLKVGDRVMAVGRVNEVEMMDARIVIILPAKEPQIKRRAVYGVVEQKVATDSATLLTLRHPKTQKTYQVVVNAQTKITGKGLTNITVSDIQIGNRITAVGTVDEAGKITAKRLHIIPGLARGLFGTQPATSSPGRRGQVATDAANP